jgi:hypothetical protein
MSFFAVEQWVKRDLAGQTGTSSRNNAGRLETGRFPPKKEARPYQTGRLTRCGAIYAKTAKKQCVLWALVD